MQSKTDTAAEPKVCESCGETFGCGAKLDGCWCVDVEIPANTATDLKLKFSDCLCPTCLSTLADAKPKK